MAGEVYSSRLPWVWVVEILARSHEVDAAILHDLITRMPKFSGDLEKEAREMIAWRCLESLFDPVDGFKNDDPPSHQSKDRLDASECCENVLQCILREALLSDLIKAGHHHLEWDIRSFIEHKKTCLPRCTLERLKDTILQGSHPLVKALKNFNGLIVQNQHNERILPDGDDIIAPPSRHDGFGVNGKATVARENINSPSSKKVKKVLKEISVKMITSPSKRDRSYLGSENHIQHSPSNMDSDLPDRKKLKQDGTSVILDAEYDSDPLDSSEQSKDASEINVLHVECELHDSADNMLDGNKQLAVSGKLGHIGESSCQLPHLPCKDDTPQDAYKSENGKNAGADEGNSETEVFRMPISLGDASSDGVHGETTAAENQESNDPHIQLMQADDTSLGKSHGQKFADGVKDNMKNCNAAETSYDSGSCRDEAAEVALKKHNFLCSQHSLSQDSLTATDWTEKNLCMKCNKGGEVLICAASGCPLVIHERCLGFSSSFDYRGDFKCPFCAYSQAISDYVDAKRKASLTRKQLSLFIGGNTSYQPKFNSEKLSDNDLNQTRPNRDVEKMGEGGCANLLTSATLHTCEQRGGGKIVVEKQKLVAGGNGLNEMEGDHCHDAAKSSHGDEKTFLEADSGEGTKQELSRQRIPDQFKDAPSASRSNPDGTAEDENATTQRYPLRRHSRGICHTHPAYPQLRRIKLAWTPEEEEMLKEGMLRFADGEDKPIPWKDVLEFGSSVFLKGRTTIDLKDKWRNMLRGRSPKSK